jgi:hypothetical protein
MKIIETFESLLATQMKINKNLEKINENIENTFKPKLEQISWKVDTTSELTNELTTNVYRKDETIDAINKEMDYKERLKKVQKQCPELLELIEIISTNYAKMDKYAILNTTEMFSEKYKVEKA